MSKRFKILMFIVAPLVLIVVISPFVITSFFFPRYRLIGSGIMFLLSGGVQIFAGFMQMRTAKIYARLNQTQAEEEKKRPLLWWQNYSFIFGLMWICFGGLFVFMALTQGNRQVNNLLDTSVGTLFVILFFLLFFGLGIYGVILASQQLVANKKPGKVL